MQGNRHRMAQIIAGIRPKGFEMQPALTMHQLGFGQTGGFIAEDQSKGRRVLSL